MVGVELQGLVLAVELTPNYISNCWLMGSFRIDVITIFLLSEFSQDM